MLKVEIDEETAHNILCVVLKSQYLDLSPNIGGCPMYSYDNEENNIKFYELKKAYQLVMEYNGIYDFKGLENE
jgi:hypothetical protein